jgi:hypothetical protein
VNIDKKQTKKFIQGRTGSSMRLGMSGELDRQLRRNSQPGIVLLTAFYEHARVEMGDAVMKG